MISMAIKYIVLPEKKQVIAILKNTKYDAYNKALKICRELTEGKTHVYMCPDPDRMMMPNEFKAIVTCKDGDTFDENTGKKIAKRICLEKYYKSFDKRIDRFKEDLDNIRMKSVIISNLRNNLV